jgi:hypothetical protein
MRLGQQAPARVKGVTLPGYGVAKVTFFYRYVDMAATLRCLGSRQFALLRRSQSPSECATMKSGP